MGDRGIYRSLYTLCKRAFSRRDLISTVMENMIVIIRKSIPQLVILQNFSVVEQKAKMLQLFEIRKICMEKTVKARPASLSCFWYILNAYNSALI